MRYGSFIVLTPLGIVSNMILVPFVPVFSRLVAAQDWVELKLKIRQSLLLTALTMLPFSAVFISLAFPIVQVIYERGAFNIKASQEVVPVLMTYGFGMFFYLARDVLVRVFYALDDAITPFRISIYNIFLNGVFDFILYKQFSTPGIVFATVSVNAISMVIFLRILNRRLGGLPLGEWGLALFGLVVISILAVLVSWCVSWGWDRVLGHDNFILLLGQLGMGLASALGSFALLATLLKLPEVDILAARIREKIGGNRF
jgi:putative peptidoglycan lipid II flippase